MSLQSISKLSELEWELMKPLWNLGPMAARDIYHAVGNKHGWAYKTLKTMLARLVKKGVLNYDQIGNSYLYRPAFNRQEFTVESLKSFVERVFDGDLQALISFCEKNESKLTSTPTKRHQVDSGGRPIDY